MCGAKVHNTHPCPPPLRVCGLCMCACAGERTPMPPRCACADPLRAQPLCRKCSPSFANFQTCRRRSANPPSCRHIGSKRISQEKQIYFQTRRLPTILTRYDKPYIGSAPQHIPHRSNRTRSHMAAAMIGASHHLMHPESPAEEGLDDLDDLMHEENEEHEDHGHGLRLSKMVIPVLSSSTRVGRRMHARMHAWWAGDLHGRIRRDGIDKTCSAGPPHTCNAGWV